MKRRERMKSRGELLVDLAIAQKGNDLVVDPNLCEKDATPDEDDSDVPHCSLMDSNDGTDLVVDPKFCEKDATPDEDDLNVLHSLMDSNDGTDLVVDPNFCEKDTTPDEDDLDVPHSLMDSNYETDLVVDPNLCKKVATPDEDDLNVLHSLMDPNDGTDLVVDPNFCEKDATPDEDDLDVPHSLMDSNYETDLVVDPNLCEKDATPDEDDLNVLHSLMDSNDGTLHFSVTSDGVLQACDSEVRSVNEPCNAFVILEETVVTENSLHENENSDSEPNGESNVNDQTYYDDTSSSEIDPVRNEEYLDGPVDKTDEGNFIEGDQNVNQRIESPNNVEVTLIDENSNKQNRKRKIHIKRDPTYSKNKRSREIGQVYESKKKIDGKWDYKVIKPKKFLKTPCQCKLGKSKSKLQCGLIPNEFRKQLFQKFWQLSWLEKKQFVKGSTVLSAVKRRRGNEEKSRRNFSLQYFLKHKMDSFRVCKKMFIGTLCLAENTFLNWVKSDVDADSDSDFGENGRPEQETRSKHEKVKISENAKIFFNSLAKVESHYCRASSSKLYLEPNWQSKRELYKFYESEWCVNENYQPVSITTFKNVFEELNLSLFKPKKDMCDICEGYKTKNITAEQYMEHQKNKEEARNEKEKDKTTSEDVVFTMDLQSVLLSPKSNVCSMYYKTKLVVHNFTIYNLKTHEGYCFLWNETDGSVSANEFSSIIVNFIENDVLPKMTDKSVNIILWSDGCSAQNRNICLANALLNTSMKYNISIIQKYLQKGHTQMEADSMHSAIERQLRNRTINVPADYVEHCKNARKKPNPYQVRYLNFEFFKNFQSIKFYTSLRPGYKVGDPVVTDLKQIHYTPEGIIFYKLQHISEEWLTLSRRKRASLQTIAYDSIDNLYKEKRKIKKEKYLHLQDLKKTIEMDFHQFYDSLPFEDNN